MVTKRPQGQNGREKNFEFGTNKFLIMLYKARHQTKKTKLNHQNYWLQMTFML
jgi:hypothetical protein